MSVPVGVRRDARRRRPVARRMAVGGGGGTSCVRADAPVLKRPRARARTRRVTSGNRRSRGRAQGDCCFSRASPSGRCHDSSGDSRCKNVCSRSVGAQCGSYMFIYIYIYTTQAQNFITFHFESSYLIEIWVILHRNWFQCHLVRSGDPKESTPVKKNEIYLEMWQVT